MRSKPMAYHRTTAKTLCINSEMIGAFCELMFPKKGRCNGIIVEDYDTEWLVQLTNGREVAVCKDEVFVI